MRPLLLFLLIAPTLNAQNWKAFHLYLNDPALQEGRPNPFPSGDITLLCEDSVSFHNDNKHVGSVVQRWGIRDSLLATGTIIKQSYDSICTADSFDEHQFNRPLYHAYALHYYYYGDMDSLLIPMLYPDPDYIHHSDTFFKPFTPVKNWSQHYPVIKSSGWIHFAESRVYSYESYKQCLEEISEKAYAQGVDDVRISISPYPDYWWSQSIADAYLAPRTFLEQSEHILLEFRISKGKASVEYPILLLNENFKGKKD